MQSILCLFFIAFSGANALSFNDANRITSGSLAADRQFPYAVSIQQLSQLGTTTRGHKCGGVLITFQHVLTAASCMFELSNGNEVMINPAEYRVFAGAAVLTDDANQSRFRFIQNYTVHPEYLAHPAYVNDIAVITLVTPFVNSTAVPLALPAPLDGPADFELCTVAGWGAENMDTSASSNLRFATKYVYSQSLCTSVYSTQFGTPNILPNMLCAASFDIVSSGCTGDEGNALVCNGRLAGIAVYTNRCMVSSFPEVYARVSNYTTWARSITGGASTFQPGVALVFIFGVVQIVTAKLIN